MKHRYSFILASAASMLSLASCGGGSTSKKAIGILQFGAFPALNNACKGFENTLKGSSLKDQVEITFKNAASDMGNNTSMASTLASTSDLVYGIATPSAGALKSAVASFGSNIPVLFSAVTDPVGANLLENQAAPEGNCTGVVDLGPIETELEYLCLFEGVSSVASFYTASEVNSVYQVRIAEDWMDEYDIAHSRHTIENSSQISSRFASIPDSVDAVFLPTDDTIANAINMIKQANESRSKPLIIVGSDVGMIDGAAFCVGVDYYQCGVQAANMAISILSGKAIKDIPVERCEKKVLSINKTWAESLGMEIPSSLLAVEGAEIL